MRSRQSNPAGGCTMSEAFEFGKLGFLRTFALEDPRSREISRLAVEEVGKIAIDAAGWAWSELKKSFSRPPQGLPPPPAAAAIPPQDASVAPPGTEPTPTPAEPGY